MRSWIHRAAAALSFAAPFAVYLRTHNPTVPFWDSGEFIAVSKILGIPHPPGTPFYVLLGRVGILLGLASPAVTLNLLAGLSGALTCLFVYLITVRIGRAAAEGRWIGRQAEAGGERSGAGVESMVLVPLAGLAAALLAGFSSTFWYNSIEAEVYSLAGLIAAVVLWAALVWRDRAEEPGSPRLLLFVGYLVALSIGIHLGVALVVPGVALLVVLARPRTLASGRFWGLLLGLAVLGVSVHLYLLIRASLHPQINEADPSTLHRLWLVLTRDQYKPPSPFIRRAAIGFQFNQMFIQYFLEQYVAGGRGIVGVLLKILPFGLAAYGAVFHAQRDRKSFAMVATTLFFTSLFLVFYLNFTDHEVRARDYFFSMAFQFLPIWIGLGLLSLARDAGAHWVRSSAAAAMGTAICALGVAFSIATCVHGYHAHDRSHYYFARDLGRNILIGLPRNAIVFTNGDNDTFPLWYAQCVERERRDVSVVCLALLNTPWYLKQVHDGQATSAVAVQLSDKEIDALHPMYDSSGRPLTVSDQGALAILKANNWQRPIYAAMTIPETTFRRLGFDGRMVIEGINIRLTREKGSRQCDPAVTIPLLDDTYAYRGILAPDGTRESKIQVDPETEGLVENYGAAYYAAALEYVRADSFETAAHAFRRALLFAPDVPQVHVGLAAMDLEMNQLDQAQQVITNAMMLWPRMPELYKLRGDLYGLRDDLDAASESYRRAIELRRDFREPYLLLYHIYQRQGQIADAKQILHDYLAVRPNDTEAQQYLSDLEKLPATGTAPAPPETTRIPIGAAAARGSR